MPHTIQLTDGTTTLDLLTVTDFQIKYAGLLTPPPPHSVTYISSRHRDGQLPAFAWHGNREITLIMSVEGTTINDLQQNASAFSKMIDQGTRFYRTAGAEGLQATLTINLSGATRTTVYYVLEGSLDMGEWATELSVTGFRVLWATVKLICLPFGDLSTDVAASTTGIQNATMSYTLSAVGGEVQTPGRYTITAKQALSGTPRLIISGRSRSTSNQVQLMECDTAAFTGYSVTTGISTYSTGTTATAHGNSFTNAGSTAAAQSDNPLFKFQISGNYRDMYGQFRALLRVRTATGTVSDVAFRFRYGVNVATAPAGTFNSSYYSLPNPASANKQTITSLWTICDLGIITWPPQQIPSTASVQTLDLWLNQLTNGAIAEQLQFDYVRLIPIDEGYIDLTLSTGLSSGDRVVVDDRGLPAGVFVANASGEFKGSVVPKSPLVGSPPLVSPGGSIYQVYLGNTTNDVLTDAVDFDLSYRPRYHWLTS